jgi:hypothetical protein
VPAAEGYTERRMTTFNVEIVLKGRDFAVTEPVTVPHGAPATWDAPAVRDVLVEILRAIGHAADPAATERRGVILQGFSWIVEPVGSDVVIAIEIPMGAAVAGPFAVDQAKLDALITDVLKAERQLAATVSTVH